MVKGMRGRAREETWTSVDTGFANVGVAVITRWGCGANARGASGSRCCVLSFCMCFTWTTCVLLSRTRSEFAYFVSTVISEVPPASVAVVAQRY